MNKKCFFLSVLAFAVIFFQNDIFAQAKGFYGTPYKDRNSGSFEKGANVVSIGYGIGNLNPYRLGYGYKRLNLGPIYLKYEKGIMDELGVGGFVSAAYSMARYNGKTYSTGLAIGLGVMGFYHFNKFIPLEKLDVYAGIGFGIKYYGQSFKDNFNKGTTEFFPSPMVKIGARYYLSNSFGVYIESGYDRLSNANIGISLKF